MANCRRCKLSVTRLCIVAPMITTPAKVLFIVEAPSSADERLKRMGRTPQARLLAEMVKNAADMLDIQTPEYQLIPMIFCRPVFGLSDADRPPAMDEILACVPNVLEAVQKCNPTQIFFCGKSVADYWAKEFPDGKTILPLWLIEKQGGVQSPNFISNVRTIVEGLKNVVR